MQDDKKKMAVLGVLVVAIIGVGAFQMMPQEPEAPPPSTEKKWTPPKDEEQVEAKVTPVRNPSVMAPLPKRDPFDVPAGASLDSEPPKPVVNTSPTPERPMNLGARPFPLDLQGLPETGLKGSETASIDPNKSSGKSPEPVKAPEPVFGYTLNGVIVGRQSAAVLRDAQGHQRLVPEGAKIDGDSTLVQVRPGGVTVEFHGKQIRIEIQGEKDAK